MLNRAILYWKRARVSLAQYGRHTTELVIVDGSCEEKPNHPHMWHNLGGKIIDSSDGTHLIRYFYEPIVEGTGNLHNLACEHAMGDIIVQWDDDDYQAPSRLWKTVEALSDEREAFLYTSKYYWYHLLTGQAALATTWNGGGGSVGATFAYHRKVWEKIRFRDVPHGEDGFFWQDLQAAKVPMVDLWDPSLLIYVRHPQNGSPLWNESVSQEATEGARSLMTPDDLDFYDGLTELLPIAQRNEPQGVRPGFQMAHQELLRRRGLLR